MSNFINTDRLELHLATLEDTLSIYEIAKDKESIEDYRTVAESKLDIRQWLASELNKMGNQWIIHKDKQPIGYISYTHKAAYKVEMGFFLNKAFHRQGIMTEALNGMVNWIYENTDIQRIEGSISENNFPACKVLEKAMFTKDATISEDRLWNGEWLDSDYYSLMKDTWMNRDALRGLGVVTLKEIDEKNLWKFLKMEVGVHQKKCVAPNSISIAQAHCSDKAWFRGIYADDLPIGFVMLYDDAEKPEYFLWRFMIQEKYQGMGYGEKALDCLVDYVKTRPNAEKLLVSYVAKKFGPGKFYEKYGFVHTGEIDGSELIMEYKL